MKTLLLLLVAIALFGCQFAGTDDEIVVSGCFCDASVVQTEEYNDFLISVDFPNEYGDFDITIISLNLSSVLPLKDTFYHRDGEYVVVRDYGKRINKTFYFEITIYK